MGPGFRPSRYPATCKPGALPGLELLLFRKSQRLEHVPPSLPPVGLVSNLMMLAEQMRFPHTEIAGGEWGSVRSAVVCVVLMRQEMVGSELELMYRQLVR